MPGRPLYKKEYSPITRLTEKEYEIRLQRNGALEILSGNPLPPVSPKSWIPPHLGSRTKATAFPPPSILDNWSAYEKRNPEAAYTFPEVKPFIEQGLHAREDRKQRRLQRAFPTSPSYATTYYATTYDVGAFASRFSDNSTPSTSTGHNSFSSSSPLGVTKYNATPLFSRFSDDSTRSTSTRLNSFSSTPGITGHDATPLFSRFSDDSTPGTSTRYNSLFSIPADTMATTPENTDFSRKPTSHRTSGMFPDSPTYPKKSRYRDSLVPTKQRYHSR
jgi:hypothetical protein